MRNSLNHITRLKPYAAFAVLTSLVFSSCWKDADFSGFIRSTDRVEERFEASMEWNAQHPFKQILTTNEDYKLQVTADVHTGNVNTINNYLKFVERGKESDITAMIFAGDISTGREKDQIAFKEQLPDQNEKPSFVMVGNHELYFDGWKYFYQLFGSSTYYFIIQTPTKKDLYICLDSGGGTLGKSQLNWLKDILDTKREDFDRCVIFTHHNFFRDHHTTSTNPLTEELILLIDLFEKHKVNMVITGHDHKRSTNQLGDIIYLTMDALKDDAENATYLLLQKESAGFDYQFIKPVD